MDELLAQTGYQLTALSRGQIVDGKVTAVSPQAVYIDVGAKSEGIVSGKEYDLVKEFIATLTVGETLKVYVRNPEDDQGNVVLSLRKAAADSIWGKMYHHLESGKPLEVQGIDTNKGGVIVSVQNLHGFIPSSQLLPEHVGKERELINTKVLVRVIEVDRSQNRLVMAEKRVVSPAEEEKRLKEWKKIKVGDKVKGLVKLFIQPGVIISLTSGLEAYLPLPEIAWERVNRQEDYFTADEPVELKVIDKNEAQARLVVSLKQLSKDPWEEVGKKYQEGLEVSGTILKKTAYGLFVELEPGIEGLIHVSKLGGETQLTTGDRVRCFIESVDQENHRIGLSLVPKEVPVIYK